MNMMSKPELFCPQLPKFEVASDVETDGSVVLFELVCGSITLNGIEVPAPFEPKVGEGYFYLNAKYKDGYSKTMREPLCNQDNKNIENGAWRTEEEIKQVVAALRVGGAE